MLRALNHLLGLKSARSSPALPVPNGRRLRRAAAAAVRTAVSESLENRLLMYTPPLQVPPPEGISFSGGLVSVNGTGGADIVSVAVEAGKVKVRMAKPPKFVQVDINTSIPLYQPPQLAEYDASQVTGLRFYGNAGDDQFTNGTGLPAVAYGGEGADVLVGGTGKDTLSGDAGDDTLRGGAGDDTLNGDAGKDLLEGQGGNDALAGGADDDTFAFAGTALGTDTVTETANVGTDTLDFAGLAASAGAVKVDLASTAAQTVGTGAVVVKLSNTTAVEGAIGTSFADTLIGNARPNKLSGLGGADKIDGKGGGDMVYAGEGEDTVFGDVGDDFLYGNGGADRIDDGDGNDTVDGGSGDDVFIARGGADHFWGGADRDSADYRTRTTALSLTLDNVKNDGQAGELDFLHDDVEILWGGSAADVIVGNAANNDLYGEAGSDTIRGGGGNDRLFGWLGADVLYGDAGNDKLYGEQNNDRLYGGGNDDESVGGDGDDTLVSIGGGMLDKNWGGGGYDSFWVDFDPILNFPPNSGELPSDVTPDENFGKTVHGVWYFANGASKELDGQNLLDPSLAGFAATYSPLGQFASTPLFGTSPGGPHPDDVVQQQIGDCYFMAGLSSIARGNPNRVSQAVVDLGDGTYAVRFWDDSAAKYYRVDNQLPLNANGKVMFAGLGRSTDRSMWVPVIEKAFAWYRGDGKYCDIVGGSCTEAFEALGMTETTDEVFWTKTSTYMNKMSDFLKFGGSVAAATDPGFLGADLTSSHCYSIVSVDLANQTVTIRNPWGKDDASFQNANPNDGYMTISADQFDDDFRIICYSL